VQVTLDPHPRVLHECSHTLDEVPPVSLGLESDQIVGQQGGEHRISLWELHEDVGRWERDVQEESQIRAATGLANMVGHIHQLIVVDPDEIVGATVRGQSLGELAVHLRVGVPVLGIEFAAGLQVVEQRPYAFV
jgi:hypothetical protein